MNKINAASIVEYVRNHPNLAKGKGVTSTEIAKHYNCPLVAARYHAAKAMGKSLCSKRGRNGGFFPILNKETSNVYELPSVSVRAVSSQKKTSTVVQSKAAVSGIREKLWMISNTVQELLRLPDQLLLASVEA